MQTGKTPWAGSRAVLSISLENCKERVLWLTVLTHGQRVTKSPAAQRTDTLDKHAVHRECPPPTKNLIKSHYPARKTWFCMRNSIPAILSRARIQPEHNKLVNGGSCLTKWLQHEIQFYDHNKTFLPGPGQEKKSWEMVFGDTTGNRESPATEKRHCPWGPWALK